MAFKSNKKLIDIIEQSESQFYEWVEILNNHRDIYDISSNHTAEERYDITMNTANVLNHISQLFFRYGNFKDTFDTSEMYLHTEGLEIIIKSKKNDTDYRLGVDDKGIYLTTYLKYSNNIRYMDDSFYSEILNLENLGKFEYLENETYPLEDKTYSKLFNNKKSNIFRILRNYIIGTVEQYDDVIIGTLKVVWAPENEIDQTISNGCLVFKSFYNLNYELWKINTTSSLKVESK